MQVTLLAILAAGSAWDQPVVSAVLNGASYSAAVAPGSWIAIFGTKLSGGSVTVGSLPAPIGYVSETQINALIPSNVVIPENTVVPLVVNSPAGPSSPYYLRLTRDAPGIFARNGAGTGRALVFDANFNAVDTVASNDTLILYATGLGSADAAGRAIDTIEVYIGERAAQVLYAGLAPGFPGIYQLNVKAPVPATDRLYIRAAGWQSNVTDIGIAGGANVTNAVGSSDGVYPSSDPFFNFPPCLDELSTSPCGPGQTFSIMLHVGTFSVGFDILPAASRFDVAAVGVGGGSVISIDPAAGTYTASVSTVTPQAVVGDFSKSVVPLWDFSSCDSSLDCVPFPGPGILPANRLDPFWLQATYVLPVPAATSATSPNATVQVSGKLNGAHFVVDSQTNAVSKFGVSSRFRWGPSQQLHRRSGCTLTGDW